MDWVSKPMYAVGYTSTQQCLLTGLQEHKKRKIRCCRFCEGKGQWLCHAIQHRDESRIVFLEGTVLYENSPNGYELPSLLTFHEVLHLHGVLGFYKPFVKRLKMKPKQRSNLKLRYVENILLYRDGLRSHEVSKYAVG